MSAADELFAQAQRLMSKGGAQEATQICQQALSVDPIHADSLLLLSQIALASGQAGAATSLLRQLLVNHADHEEGWSLLRRRQSDERLQVPDVVDAIVHLAEAEEVDLGAKFWPGGPAETVPSTAQKWDGGAQMSLPDRYNGRPSFLAEFQSAVVTPDFLPVTAGNSLARSGLSLFPLRPAVRDAVLSVYPEILAVSSDRVWMAYPSPAMRVDRPAYLVSGGPVGGQNYYHWLIDYLPRLWAIDHERVPDDVLIIVNEDLSEVQRDSLIHLGIDGGRVIRKDPQESIYCQRLFAPSFESDTGNVYAGAVRFLRTAFDIPETPTGNRRLYISRRGAAARRVRNEADVEACFVGYGFDVIQPEDMPLSDQVAAFNGSVAIAGPHGGGFANMVFAPPGARVIELVTKQHTALASLAAASGHPYWHLLADKCDDEHGNVEQAEYAVDINLLDKLLEEVFAGD